MWFNLIFFFVSFVAKNAFTLEILMNEQRTHLSQNESKKKNTQYQLLLQFYIFIIE